MSALHNATIEAQAADWLMERENPDWNETDQAALDAWLAQSLAHRIAYLRLEATWGRTERLVALRNPIPEAVAPARPRMPLLFAGIAAALALVTALGFGAAHFLAAPKDRVFATSVGGRKLVNFADGTQIELNTDTVLRARMTTNERTVWIEKGEAYFRVKHDANNPFVVIAGHHRITDLGTKFLVRRDGTRLEVALLEGSVRYSAGAKAKLLKPGDDLVAAKQTALTKKTTQELANELGWRRGVLVFRHTTLADAAAEFNRYNTRKIEIAGTDAARRTIDGTFLTNDLDAFTDAAQTIFGLKVREQGQTIVISR